MVTTPMSPPPAAKVLTILIVDDDVALIRSLERAFQQLGQRVISAINAESALELARTHQPDIALVDLQLGEGMEDGHSVCARICALHQKTLVFIWSGAPPGIICYQSLRAGAVEHLTKPVPASELLARFLARIKLDSPLRPEL